MLLLTTMIRSQGTEATERFVESIPSELQSELYSLRVELMSRMTVALMHEDIDLAIQWTEKHGEGKQGIGLLVHLAHYWGAEDGPAALDWAIGLPERERKPRIIKQAWIGFLRAEPDEATAWIQAREPDEATKGIYAEYLRHFARTEPELALELAQRATDPEIRDRMLVATGRGWMRSDPESAAAWLAGVSPDLQAQIRGDAEKNSQPKPIPVRNPS
jgi:hypothetical protein